jgi:hypothetical protein
LKFNTFNTFNTFEFFAASPSPVELGEGVRR